MGQSFLPLVRFFNYYYYLFFGFCSWKSIFYNFFVITCRATGDYTWITIIVEKDRVCLVASIAWWGAGPIWTQLWKGDTMDQCWFMRPLLFHRMREGSKFHFGHRKPSVSLAWSMLLIWPRFPRIVLLTIAIKVDHCSSGNCLGFGFLCC